MHYTYLLLLLLTVSYPLFKSFETKIHYYTKWKYLFPSIIPSTIFFIVWDIWFVNIGVWKFNTDYIIGFSIFNLPIEEWLFFIIVPFSCVFIYEVLNYFIKRDILARQSKYITILLAVILFILSLIFHDRTYTFTTFLFLGVFLLLHQFVFKSRYLGRFYLTWLVCLIPFFLINGVLTAMPVLIYNNQNMLGVRLWTIPLEDVFYGMLNILQVITVYEWLKKRSTV